MLWEPVSEHAQGPCRSWQCDTEGVSVTSGRKKGNLGGVAAALRLPPSATHRRHLEQGTERGRGLPPVSLDRQGAEAILRRAQNEPASLTLQQQAPFAGSLISDQLRSVQLRSTPLRAVRGLVAPQRGGEWGWGWQREREREMYVVVLFCLRLILRTS